MAKRPLNRNSDMELSAIREQLVNMEYAFRLQAKSYEELTVIIKGSEAMNVPGMVAMLTRFESQINQLVSDMAHFQRWKQKMTDDKGKITITVGVLLQRIFAVIGAVGTVVGIVMQFIK